MLIAVLGPDGAGKTTLARKLAAKYPEITYVYFGNNPESRMYFYFKNFLSIQRKGKLNTILRYLAIFFNDLAYFNKAKREDLIADRCPIDKILQSSIAQDKGRLMYHKLAQKFLPHPDFIILLGGDSHQLYERKKEISVEKIKAYLGFYEDYFKRHKLNFHKIDSVTNDEENTFEIASKLLEKELWKK